MLVSRCCKQPIFVESNHETSYYVCAHCYRPSDPVYVRFSINKDPEEKDYDKSDSALPA